MKAGLVVRPEEWRWSSVHDFSGRAAEPIVANNASAIDRVELPWISGLEYEKGRRITYRRVPIVVDRARHRN